MNNKIVKTSIQVSLIVLIIKVLGLLKQSIIAMICGATYETDLYFLASGLISQLCIVIFSSISISLLSIYVEKKHSNGDEYASSVINSVLKAIIPIGFILGMVFSIYAPFFATILAPSYNSNQINELSEFIRMMSILFILNGYYLTINVALEANKIMLPGKVLNLLQNLLTIIFAILLFERYGSSILIFALVFANVVSCIYITIRARKYFRIEISSIFQKKEVLLLISLSVPLLIGNAMYEINDIIDKQIASNFGNGVVSYLSYGTSINEIISSLIGTTISSILFVHYATWAAEGKKKLITEKLEKSISVLIFILLPITVVTIICRYDIVSFLYGRGSFNHTDIINTSLVVLGYAVGFVFQALRANLVKVFYSLKDTKTPMINGIICITVNITLSILMSRVIGISGVAFATSIAMLVATILLTKRLKKLLPLFRIFRNKGNYFKLIILFFITMISTFLLYSTLSVSSFIKLIVTSVWVYIVFGVGGLVLKESNIEYICSKIKTFVNK